MRKVGHIALVLHDFSSGGSERVAIRLANLWAAAGRRVTILCGLAAGPARELVGPDVAVCDVAPAVPHARGSRARLGRALAMTVTKITPDIIVGPGNFHLPVLAALSRALGPHRPAIVGKLSNALVRPDRGRMAQALFAWQLRRTVRGLDRLVAMSEGLAAEARLVLPAARVEMVPGPNLPKPPLPRTQHGGTHILAAGRLVPQKAFSLALRAFAHLSDRAAQLTLLGDGPERERLVVLARALGVADRVALPGHVADISPWLARADAFLLTSRYEGYPAVLIEAISAGVPVVTTACSPAIPEIVADPSSGRIVPASPEALADALCRVVEDGPPSQAERERLLARHAPEASAAAWLALLDETVAGYRR